MFLVPGERSKQMIDLFNQLENFLAASFVNLDNFTTLEAAASASTTLEHAGNQVILRLARAFLDYEEGHASLTDVAVLLRQVIRTHHRRISIPNRLMEGLREIAFKFGLQAVRDDLKGGAILNADSWQPNWLPATNSIDRLDLRRKDPPVPGDGLLYAASKTLTYKSEAQKAAVQACLFSPEGSSTLITLPTGAGKSMCILLPAWQSSQGGTVKGGTTLVVVPTVSLALDQVSRAKTYFRDARNEAYEPHALVGGTSEEEKEIIFRAFLNGTLPVLYTSPESLLNTRLYNVCLTAAENGLLNRLVVDEAHIVETWGAGFRTEFQLLAAYQKLLLGKSGDRLRTVLLSATVSENCENLLEHLFATPMGLNRVKSNRLRPEPSFWFSFCQREDERQRRVLDAVHYLPRPLILYVTRPIQASEWNERLGKAGFKRLATYTGDTNDTDRRFILDKWQNDEIDIMVATSAFGLGVDKGEIRTIIHACLPENLDRFYQEVGRSGRDGCSSISLACGTHEDKDLAFSMTRTNVITPERAADRWLELWKNRKGEGSVWSVDINVTPEEKSPKRRRLQPSEVNQEWNEHTLLLMQRAGFIRIRDSQDKTLQLYNRVNPGEDEKLWKQFEILNWKIVDNRLAFETLIKPYREQEREHIENALNKMRNLVSNYSKNDISRCVAYEFSRLYPDCTLACGGCPSCRNRGRPPYSEKLQLEIDTTRLSARYKLQGDLAKRLGHNKTLNLFWEGQTEPIKLPDLDDFLVNLVQSGFHQLILPNALLDNPVWTSSLVEKLSYLEKPIAHLIAGEDWPGRLPLYPVPTALVYPNDNTDSDNLYRAWQSTRQPWPTLPEVNIINRNIYLESEHGYFTDRVHGSVERLDQWQLSLALEF